MIISHNATLSPIIDGKVLDVTVSHIEVVEGKNKHHVYATFLCRQLTSTGSCGAVSVIYRRYKEFRQLEHVIHKLLKLHKVHLGLDKGLHNIPRLAKSSMFSKKEKEYVARIRSMDEFLVFVIKLPDQILSAEPVKKFFHVKESDIERLKRRKSNDIYHEVFDISDPVSSEYHQVRENYTKSDPCELSLVAGEEVKIMKKDDSGWWLAVSANGAGWVPSSYLHTEFNQYPFRPGYEEYHVVTRGYKKVLDDEISIPEGAIVQVLDRNISGWWEIRFAGQTGLAPGTNLHRADTTRAKRAFHTLGTPVSGQCCSQLASMYDSSSGIGTIGSASSDSSVSTISGLSSQSTQSLDTMENLDSNEISTRRQHMQEINTRGHSNDEEIQNRNSFIINDFDIFRHRQDIQESENAKLPQDNRNTYTTHTEIPPDYDNEPYSAPMNSQQTQRVLYDENQAGYDNRAFWSNAQNTQNDDIIHRPKFLSQQSPYDMDLSVPSSPRIGFQNGPQGRNHLVWTVVHF